MNFSSHMDFFAHRSSHLTVMIMVLLGVSTELSAADAVPHVEFHIPPQSVESALIEFSRQADTQIMVSTTEVAGQRTSGVNGILSVDDALAQVLQNTGLTYKAIGNTVAVTRGAHVKDPELEDDAAPAAQTGSRELGRSRSPLAPAPVSVTDKPIEGRREAGSVEEIVVTGSHIRGITSSTIPTIVYDRDAIERTGFTSTQQFVRSLPQNFSGGSLGATEDGRVGPGALAQTNVSSATGINLRGLGNASTLVLVNGHRLAPSAYGVTVDISQIPLAAVDRIEVLMDGSSALYGSDAVAGVVNFILRRDYKGAETRVGYGSVTEGSLSEQTFNQTLGHRWARGSAIANLHYRDRAELDSTQRSFTAAAPQPTDLLPDYKEYSLALNAQHTVAPRLDAFADAFFSHKDNHLRYATPSSRGSDASTTRQSAINGGLGYNLFGTWRLELAGLYSSEHTGLRTTSSIPIAGYKNGDPLLRNDFSLTSVDLKLDGSVLELPGGTAKMALGGSYRSERFSSLIPYNGEDRGFDRRVYASFAELYVPVVGQPNRYAFAKSIALSAAVRHDHYSDFGGTTNPRFGVIWSPLDGLSVQAAYSRSFRAPNASEQINASTVGLVLVSLPFAAPDGSVVPVFSVGGSNRFLLPEKSRDFSLGVDYGPPSVPNLKLALNYYRIKFSDRIVTPPFDTGALLRRDVYGSLIVDLADDEEAQAFLDAQLAQGATFFDLVGSGVAGVRHVFSRQQQNAAEVTQNGLDASAQYSWALGQSTFSTRVTTSAIHEILTAFSPDSTPTDLVDTYNNPLQLRIRGDFQWSRSAWTANAAVNYSGGYVDTSSLQRVGVDSWTTVDLNLRLMPKVFEGLSLGLSLINVLDEDPPLVSGLGLTGIHYDTANATPLGRFLAFEIRKNW